MKLRGAFKTKNVTNCGKSQKGWGGQQQNQNSLHFKCRLTLTWEGLNFSHFSQIQITEI